MLQMFIGLYVLGVGALIIAELTELRFGQIIFKPLVALGFIGLATLSGALDGIYGQIVLAGLIACALGDVALLSRGNPFLFKLGMVAFAIGHLLYAGAFFRLGIQPIYALLALFVMGMVSLGVYKYLRPSLPADMVGAVLIYICIITLMVVTSIGTRQILLIIPAIMFAVSDIFVARDRFVTRKASNALLISPLYFGAQALFALSAGLF